MRPNPCSIRRLTPLFLVLGVLLPSLVPLPASAVPALGFREDWPGTSLQGWSGGSDYANPGTGGVDGAGDGFLKVSTAAVLHLGTTNSGDPYPGNWVAAGIQLVLVSLNDVGTSEALSIHFSIGNAFNFWQYNPGFSPPHNQWAEFVVDLTDAANFTRIIGSGTFTQALSNVDRIHFRHDLAPYLQTPNSIQGDVGIDRLIITNPATPASSTTWGRIKAVYR